MVKKYRYSEIFRSIQGEGFYSGTPTIWLRSWGCNFSCLGFGAPEGVDPRTVKEEDLPFTQIDISNITKMEDLPVFDRGCDSSYSWSKRFAHLAHKDTAEDICKKLTSLLPGKVFENYHLAFTGGEPMMSQSAIVDIIKTFRLQWNPAMHVTIETNGTQMPRDEFNSVFINSGMFQGELFWSCSPKLRASGEAWEDAINPDVLRQYNLISTKGQLKYVVDGTDDCWDEVAEATELYRKVGISWPVWIMPVGATVEEQQNIQEKICEQSLDRGYNFSARIHCFIYGNRIGT